MKKSKIIAPALGVLILSTAASISGTVAWFSANNAVTVTGMSVKTKVSSNLFITGDTLANTAAISDDLFHGGELEQEISKILLPVSTVNGTSFFYGISDKGDGSIAAANNAWTAYGENGGTATHTDTYGNQFSEDYGLNKTDAGNLIANETAAYGYVDYVFRLKAVNTSAAALPIKVTTLSLTYGGTETVGNDAFRVAIFAQELAGNGTASSGEGTLKVIAATSNAANYTSGKAISSASEKGNVVYNVSQDPARSFTIADVAVSATKYYKVVVRLWLEGEDQSCTNETFAALTNTWSLDLGLTFDSGTAAVSNLTAASTPAQQQNP